MSLGPAVIAPEGHSRAHLLQLFAKILQAKIDGPIMGDRHVGGDHTGL